MSVLNDQLSLREVAYRWAGEDPAAWRMRAPLAVKDRIRTLLYAVLHGELYCSTLALEKWSPASSLPPEFFIRHYLAKVYACIEGGRCDRRLLDWATIDRWAMRAWCEARNIPLPDFWFPRGWRDYDAGREALRSDEDAAKEDLDVFAEGEPSSAARSVGGGPEELSSVTGARSANEQITNTQEDGPGGKRLHDRRVRAKIACQEVAARLWLKRPEATVKVIAASDEVQKIAGGEDYSDAAVLAWLGEIDRRPPEQRRGRKRKNNSVR